MIAIVPAILEATRSGLEEKIRRLETHFALAQLDVCDGKFVSSKTLSDPSILDGIKTSIEFEVHLMVRHPEAVLLKWMKVAKVVRVIAHLEAMEHFDEWLFAQDQTQKELGLAVNLDTRLSDARPYFQDIDLLLLMGVQPGAQGRSMDPAVIDRVAQVREIRDQQFQNAFTIAVDGGVNDGTAPELIRAGADVLNVGSYLFQQKSFDVALKQLTGASSNV